jgi:mRNA interferase RelE/StbE
VGKYKVTIKPSAVKELDRIPKKILRQIVARIDALTDNPRPQGVEKLSGGDQYRIRQGDQRIVYSIDDSQEIVDVVKIGHRREVYR